MTNQAEQLARIRSIERAFNDQDVAASVQHLRAAVTWSRGDGSSLRGRDTLAAATDGLAKLISAREFSVLFHEGQQDHIHISIAAKRAILVVIFDDRSSLGLVRLRVKRAHADLERIFEAMLGKSCEAGHGHASPFSEITDEKIEALFGE